MVPFSYAEVLEDSSANSRERDGRALDFSIDLMRKAEKEGAGSVASAEALYFATRLWMAFLTDLGREDNGLSKQLRAALISVGLSLLREADRIRRGEADSFDQMIEISSIVREGLR